MTLMASTLGSLLGMLQWGRGRSTADDGNDEVKPYVTFTLQWGRGRSTADDAHRPFFASPKDMQHLPREASRFSHLRCSRQERARALGLVALCFAPCERGWRRGTALKSKLSKNMPARKATDAISSTPLSKVNGMANLEPISFQPRGDRVMTVTRR
jgi:hypothetical protein